MDSKKLFRVKRTFGYDASIIVKASNQDEAREIAENVDGGQFIEETDSNFSTLQDADEISESDLSDADRLNIHEGEVDISD